MSVRRVAVTGIGAITSIGCGAEGLWAGVCRAQPSAASITRFDASTFRSQVACEVRDFDPTDFIDAKRARRTERFSQFALAAAHQALANAALEPGALDSTRAGATLGSALGGIGFAEGQYRVFEEQGLRGVDPSLALSVFVGAGGCNIAMEFDMRGPNTSNSNSCSSGAIGIGEGFRFIRAGLSDVMLAGASDAPLFPLTYGAFSLIRAMSACNQEPHLACRPFDLHRDGFVMAEGAGVLVLEEWGHAQRRDARIYAELLGYGLTNDAYHMTAPRPDGSSAARAMRLALDEAGLSPGEIEHVNAHASSTPLNDKTETLAIKDVFGDRAARIPISGTKGMHGHSLGASGAIEAAIACLTLQHGLLPATVNLHTPDPECDLDYVPNHPRPATVRTILCNSFGFGGINACLVLADPNK